MRKSRFTESQIVAISKEGEAGVSIDELTQASDQPHVVLSHYRHQLRRGVADDRQAFQRATRRYAVKEKVHRPLLSEFQDHVGRSTHHKHKRISPNAGDEPASSGTHAPRGHQQTGSADPRLVPVTFVQSMQPGNPKLRWE